MGSGGSLYLYFICGFAAIGGFCFGYDSGVVSGKPFFTLNQRILNGFKESLKSLRIFGSLMKILKLLITDLI